MTQIATSAEQGNRLMGCDVRVETADMCLSRVTGIYYTDAYKGLPSASLDLHYPVWSLSRLFDLLPKKLTVGIRVHELNMGFEPYEENFYIRYINSLTDSDELDSYTDAADPIEACVKMVEWLTKHSYELNTIKQ